MTIRFIIDLIDRMLRDSNEEISQHAQTLVGPRTRGSVSEKGLDALPEDRSGEEFDPGKGIAIPGCRYLRFQASEIGGRLGAVPLASALERGWPVGVRSGKHGYEMFVDRDPSLAEMPKTDILTVVLGPFDGVDYDVVWTWHPGEPLASAKAGLTDSLAVKVHNG